MKLVTRPGVKVEPTRNGTVSIRLVQTVFRSTPQDLLHRCWGQTSEESIKRALRLDTVTHLSNCLIYTYNVEHAL
jgi:hypothetical protein